MIRACVYCGASLKRQRSVEHVFPRWLQERYGLSSGMVLQTHFSEKGEVLSDRHHSLGSHVLGRVCANCNNGWMSRLETRIKPTVIGLAERALELSELRPEECLLLGRWACKTAYVLHAASNYRMIVKQQHFLDLAKNRNGLPNSVWVFARQHRSTEPFCWWQGPTWHMEGDEDFVSEATQETIKQSAYKICFSIKDLILLTVYNPLPRGRLVVWKGIHYPVYPQRGPVYWYEKHGFPDDNTDKACVALLASIGIKQIEDQTSNE